MATAIQVRDLGIRYDLRLARRTTIKRAFVDLRPGRRTDTAFWAVRNVSFDVMNGDSLALVGPNGAGKTTILLALAGILTPEEGEVRTYGRTSALLTLGAGFDADLSGRDNIGLAGAFLDIPHSRMAELTPEIVAFADIGQFIDAPLRTYSAGMRARLGFSIATSISPDILLLDEVLGTGDESFKARSLARIQELVSTAKAVVVVTHDLDYVATNCSRAILVEDGRVICDGAPADVIPVYAGRVRRPRSDLDRAEPRPSGRW